MLARLVPRQFPSPHTTSNPGSGRRSEPRLASMPAYVYVYVYAYVGTSEHNIMISPPRPTHTHSTVP